MQMDLTFKFFVVFTALIVGLKEIPITKVLAAPAVYGPKAGTKKNENPEKASIEVIWKPKTGKVGNWRGVRDDTKENTTKHLYFRWSSCSLNTTKICIRPLPVPLKGEKPRIKTWRRHINRFPKCLSQVYGVFGCIFYYGMAMVECTS
ncbi:uncharacterized protein LOC130804595 isoform X2 [Amaranthus tricolor]|uniref:uncharacterized protein LOC130804595 isoform X2 n=1 Tax=Amaranthus tricolor TaxID=29722 RepID=UPI0025858AA4|nr:uncharacterized protein LOC130804595 isoform X2 [Amaranthus tricolor]